MALTPAPNGSSPASRRKRTAWRPKRTHCQSPPSTPTGRCQHWRGRQKNSLEQDASAACTFSFRHAPQAPSDPSLRHTPHACITKTSFRLQRPQHGTDTASAMVRFSGHNSTQTHVSPFCSQATARVRQALLGPARRAARVGGGAGHADGGGGARLCDGSVGC